MGIIALDTWKTRVSIAVANAVNVVYKDEFAAIIGRSKLVAVVQSFEQLSATRNYWLFVSFVNLDISLLCFIAFVIGPFV